MDLQVEQLLQMNASANSLYSDINLIGAFQAIYNEKDIMVCIEWILSTCRQIRSEDWSLGQQSASIFLRALTKLKVKSCASYELLAWESISLSFKLSGYAIPIEMLQIHMNSRFSPLDIIGAESFMLTKIAWDIQTPSINEAIWLLISQLVDTDTSSILQPSIRNANKFYTDFNTLSNGFLVIAIYSILKAMENYMVNSSEFIAFCSSNFPHELKLATGLQ